MVNVRALREIVVTLRGLVWKARDAGAPVASDVLTMAAGAVQDMARAEKGAEPVAGPEQTVRRMREE